MPTYADKHIAQDGSGCYFYIKAEDNDGWEFKTTAELEALGGADAYRDKLKEARTVCEYGDLRLTCDKAMQVWRIFKLLDDNRWIAQEEIDFAANVPLLKLLIGALNEIGWLRSNDT